MAALLVLQAFSHFWFFFRTKVKWNLKDEKVTYYPSHVRLNYWGTYVVIPFILIVILVFQLAVEEHVAVRKLLLFLLFVKISSLIWYYRRLYPRYCEILDECRKKWLAYEYIREKAEKSGLKSIEWASKWTEEDLNKWKEQDDFNEEDLNSLSETLKENI